MVTLAEGRLAAGRHVFEWNGRDADGRQTASGVYFCRLSTDAGVSVRKIILLD
jgi:hypothetical protein